MGLRGSGLYKAYCRDLHCFVTVPHSCAFCHNMSSVHIFTHTQPGLLGNEKGGVCWRSVCVCERFCQLAGGGGLHIQLGGGIVCEGGLFLKEMERSF